MHSHRLYKLMAVFLLAGLFLTACSGSGTPASTGTGTSAPQGTNLQGKTWLWQKTEFNNGKDIPVVQPDAYTLQFMPDGTVNIKADCNSGGGVYSVTDNVDLTIHIATMTQAACPAGSLSDEYVKELNDTGSYTIDRNGELVFALKSGAGMRFKAQ